MNDFRNEKRRLREYLERTGIEYNSKRKTWRCPNPAHDDKTPSSVLYDNQDVPYLWCPVCQESWSVFDVAGMINNTTDFTEMLKSVRQTLNINENEEITAPQKKKEHPKSNPLPFPPDKKTEINNKIISVAKDKEWGSIKGSWKYFDGNKNIMALDVRFEKEGERKNIITFWYDGKLLWHNTPVFIYGLENYGENSVVIIHEGAKCASIGQNALPEYCHLSWGGGSGKAHLADWSFLKNNEVYILPDSDHKIDEKTKEEWPKHKQPGMKAALAIQKQLPHAKIIECPDQLKNIDGADIEDYLQSMSIEDVRQHIEQCNAGVLNQPVSPDTTTQQSYDALLHNDNPPIDDAPVLESSMPYTILGMGDDGKAAFITEDGRFEKWNLDGMSKQKLMVLADMTYWQDMYGDGNKIYWDKPINDIIRLAQKKDFNESQIRGRGAWRDGDKISYHDGVNTIGEVNNKKIYLRLPQKDIGITDKPANAEIRKQVKDNIMKMSFETPADAVRCLAWSVLAPFAGALTYRPAMLLTGPSGSGKTTVTNLCIRKLADCEWFNGSESTIAGVRGKIKHDTCGIMFEETEKDTIKKSLNREDLFSLMRVSVSNDAPDTVKGTKDGGYNSFKMQNMFGFIAINPTVESIADENRIFRINMANPKNNDGWSKIENEIKQLLNETNCRAIRAYTWNNLKNILSLADKLVDKIRYKTKRDYRSSYADAMLVSAFIIVWTGQENPTDEQIDAMLEKYYTYQQAEEHRDESTEMIDRMLDEQIEILHGHGGREKLTMAECLNVIITGKRMNGDGDLDIVTGGEKNEYKLHVSRYGIRVMDDGEIAICNNHHMVKKILQTGSGYAKILKRHKGFVDSKPVYYFDGKIKYSTIIKGVFI